MAERLLAPCPEGAFFVERFLAGYIHRAAFPGVFHILHVALCVLSGDFELAMVRLRVCGHVLEVRFAGRLNRA